VYNFYTILSKGYQVNIPELGCGFLCGNATKLGDASRDPGKSYLFFLTDYHHESDLVGDMVSCQAKQNNFVLSGAFLTALENPRERFIFTPSRTHNRSRSPR
jgi:hypothetical protein